MKYHVPTKMLVIVLRNLMRFFTKKSFYLQGFFAVNGELFFMFLFLIPFTIRQQCLFYPDKFSTDPFLCCFVGLTQIQQQKKYS